MSDQPKFKFPLLAKDLPPLPKNIRQRLEQKSAQYTYTPEQHDQFMQTALMKHHFGGNFAVSRTTNQGIEILAVDTDSKTCQNVMERLSADERKDPTLNNNYVDVLQSSVARITRFDNTNSIDPQDPKAPVKGARR